MAFSLPYTLVAGTPENVNNVQSDLGAIKDELNGVTNTATPAFAPGDNTVTSAKIVDGTIVAADCAAAFAKANVEPAFSSYKELGKVLGDFASSNPAATYEFDGEGGVRGNGGNQSTPVEVLYLDPADYTADTRTTKYRVRAVLLTNATAPTINFTFGLYPVSSVAGTAGTSSATLGTVVSGSTVVFTAQAASTRGQGNSGDFTAPAAGFYALGVVSSGTPAAGSFEVLSAQLQVRQV